MIRLLSSSASPILTDLTYSDHPAAYSDQTSAIGKTELEAKEGNLHLCMESSATCLNGCFRQPEVERQCLQVPRWEPHPGSREGLTGVGGGLGCASALGLPLERWCCLEVLPPRGRPCWQNKQGGGCLCGQIEPSRRSECGKSPILFHPGWDGGLETEGTT